MDMIKAVIGAVVATAFFIFGSGWLWNRHKKKVRTLEEQRRISEAKARVAELDGMQKVIAEQSGATREQLEEVRKERIKVIEQIVSIDHEIKDMSDEELEKAFQDMY